MAAKALTAYESRTDLGEYGDDGLLLFALQLRWGITDIEGVAAEALTDHGSEIEEDERTSAQQRHMEFFRRRGSISLMVAAISDSIETFLDQPVPDRTSLRFKSNLSPQNAADAWTSVVDSALPFSNQLLDATDLGLKNTATVDVAMEKFQSMVEATVDANRKKYADFAKKVEITT